MGYLFVAFLLVLFLAVLHAQAQDPDPKTHGQWVAFQITNMGAEELEVKNAALKWGKWYEFPKQDDEVDPPNGMIIKPGKTGPSTPFAASGRASSMSGTEGTFDLYSGDEKVATIYFDCPWSGKNDLQVQHSCEECIVQLPPFNKEGALGSLTIKALKMPSLVKKA